MNLLLASATVLLPWWQPVSLIYADALVFGNTPENEREQPLWKPLGEDGTPRGNRRDAPHGSTAKEASSDVPSLSPSVMPSVPPSPMPSEQDLDSLAPSSYPTLVLMTAGPTAYKTVDRETNASSNTTHSVTTNILCFAGRPTILANVTEWPVRFALNGTAACRSSGESRMTTSWSISTGSEEDMSLMDASDIGSSVSISDPGTWQVCLNVACGSDTAEAEQSQTASCCTTIVAEEDDPLATEAPEDEDIDQREEEIDSEAPIQSFSPSYSPSSAPTTTPTLVPTARPSQSPSRTTPPSVPPRAVRRPMSSAPVVPVNQETSFTGRYSFVKQRNPAERQPVSRGNGMQRQKMSSMNGGNSINGRYSFVKEGNEPAQEPVGRGNRMQGQQMSSMKAETDNGGRYSFARANQTEHQQVPPGNGGQQPIGNRFFEPLNEQNDQKGDIEEEGEEQSQQTGLRHYSRLPQQQTGTAQSGRPSNEESAEYIRLGNEND